MGNLREVRQLTPRKGRGVVVPVRTGQSFEVARVLDISGEPYSFYICLCTAGTPIHFPNLDGPDVNLGLRPFDCVIVQSGGKMWCGYERFVERVRALAPYVEDTLFYVGDEEDYIDEFRVVAGVLEYRRVHSGYWLPVRKFLRSRGIRQSPNQPLRLTGKA